MQLQLHPTRNEALTASGQTLTRWSLATTPATILVQASIAPEWVFPLLFAVGDRVVTLGGITGIPDGKVFALQQLPPGLDIPAPQTRIEWRGFEDLSPVRFSEIPYVFLEIGSLTNSPDGRWLVLGSCHLERLFLLDWQTGAVLSHHTTGGYFMSGLIFDASSTFVAGVCSNEEGGFLQVWRLVPAEGFVPRAERQDWRADNGLPPDEVRGPIALTPVPWEEDLPCLAWPDRDLAGALGIAAFSPDSRLVVFLLRLNLSYCKHGFDLVAIEAVSGKERWRSRHEEDASGSLLFTPDGQFLLVPEHGGNLLLYRVEDGVLAQQLSTGLDEPVQALAFDHDGSTLWLATEEALVQYKPPG